MSFKRNQIVHVGSASGDFFFFGRIVKKATKDEVTGEQNYVVVWCGKNFGILPESHLKETDYKGYDHPVDLPDWKYEKAEKIGKEKFRWFEKNEYGFYDLKKSFLKMSSMRALKQSAGFYHEVFKGVKPRREKYFREGL